MIPRPPLRIGHGIDIHAFGKGRELILGGVRIAHERGLLGHSDADVVLHAVVDGLLGAIAAGDIGTHFPDTDERYSGMDSAEFTRKAVTIVHRSGYRVANVDVCVLLERPKLRPHIEAMQVNLATLLQIERNCCSVKATTGERLGFIGREEGIFASATVLLEDTRQ